MRQNAQEIEIAAWSHDFRGFVEKLNFAGSIGDAAVFLVSRNRRENDIRLLRGFGQKHFMNDQQRKLSAAEAERAKVSKWIGADDIERLELAGLRGVNHLRGRYAGF